MSSALILPAPLELVHFIANASSSCTGPLSTHSSEFYQLRTWLSNDTPLSEIFKSEKVPSAIRFVQLSFLTGLSFYGGMSLSKIHGVSIQDKLVTVQWTPRLIRKVELDKYDRSCQRFLSTFFLTVFQKKLDLRPSLRCLEPVSFLVKSHLDEINATIDQHKTVLAQHPKRVVDGLKNDPSLLFILLSSLPIDSLNTFYLRLQQVVPPEIQVKLTPRRQVMVKNFFQKESTDVRFLFLKLKLHFNIMFYSDAKEKETDLTNHTANILDSLLQEESVYYETRKGIQSVLDDQLDTWGTLYQLYLRPLSRLFSHEEDANSPLAKKS